jgi:hypothetical protein
MIFYVELFCSQISSAIFFDSLLARATMVNMGGLPGAWGITLASEIKSPLMQVSRFLSTTLPIAAVPPG